MSWKDKLKSASFKGAKFFVTTADSEFGRRFQHFEYPNRDKGYIEDLGQKDPSFALEAYIVGNDYMDLRDKLIKACNSEGTGELVHPYLGIKTVTCTTFRIRESAEEGGVARISFNFIEAGIKEQPSSNVNTQKSVYSLGKESILVSSADFVKRFKTENLPSFISENAKQQIEAAQSLISSAISVKTGSTPISLLKSAVIDDYTTASEFGSKILGLFDSFTTTSSAENPVASSNNTPTEDESSTSLTTAQNEYLAAKTLFNYSSSTSIVVSSVTTTGSVLNTNTKAIDDLIIRNATVVAAKTSTQIEFSSYDDAVATRDELIEQINKIIEQTSSDEIYIAFSNLKTTVNKDITSRGADLAKVTSFSLNKTTPSLVVSYNRYGSIDNANDISSRNNVANPLFVPGGKKLEALSK